MGSPISGECHRFPPKMRFVEPRIPGSPITAMPYFLSVCKGLWCAEYRPRPETVQNTYESGTTVLQS